jgi:hypothetical protein
VSDSERSLFGDDETRPWLDALRTGTPHRRIEARAALARIFEQRGMLAEATDLLLANVEAGFLNGQIYRWLERLYLAQGQNRRADEAAAEARKYETPSVVVRSHADPHPDSHSTS